MNIDRVNSELLRQLGNVINNELRDPRINGIISIIEVRCSIDLSSAKVYVSVYNSENQPKEVVERLNACQGFIRNLLKTRIKLRNIPIFKFILDESIEFALKIDDILSGKNTNGTENKTDKN